MSRNMTMSTAPIVKVSPKYQVVIPKQVRQALNIQVGQRLQVWHNGHSLELVPVEPIADLAGAFPEIPPFERESDRGL